MAAWEIAKNVGGDTEWKGQLSADAAQINLGATSGDSAISQAYDHLYLVVSPREGNSNYYVDLEFRFNDDSSPYSNTNFWASAAAENSNRTASNEVGDVISTCASNGIVSNGFGFNSLWIANYSGSGFKQCLMEGFAPNMSATDSQWRIMYSAGLFAETGPIKKIRIQGAGGPEFMANTSWVLYGITGAS